MTRVLPSITTISRSQSTWRQKLIEVHELGVKEVALFVTALSDDERKECFVELKKLKAHNQYSIPFCHATSSMLEDDYWFLVDNFGTERFNLHPFRCFPHQELSQKLRQRIYIENSGPTNLLTAEDIEGYGGVCLDISHLHDLQSLKPEHINQMTQVLEAFTIGANHISGARQVAQLSYEGELLHSTHSITDPSDFDYLRQYPAKYFSDMMAIEVENPIKEQLEYRNYIEVILGSHNLRLKPI